MAQPDSSALTPGEIEAALDRDRAELARTIAALQQRLTADALIGDVLAYGRRYVAPCTTALDKAVRANPLAAVMVGAGIAWLVLGRKTAPPPVPDPGPLSGTRFEALARWEDEGGAVAPLPDPDQAWIAEADSLRNRAAAAQTRILLARERAYAARSIAARRGSRLIMDRPLLAGAIGMAIGAVIAAVLPRTSTEDRLFGQDRDALLDQARQALRAERSEAAAHLSESESQTRAS